MIRKISFKVKIIESFYDGFRGIIPNKKILFNVTTVRDYKVLKDHLFKKNDMVTVTLELVNKIKQDIINTNKIEFYIVVFQLATNGIYTKEYRNGDNPLKTIFFFESRGMITSPALKSDDFEIGNFVKVTIKK